MEQEKRSWAARRPRTISPSRGMLFSGMAGLVLCLAPASQSAAQDTPANIIADQIGRQGFPCEEPHQAEHDKQASRPNEAVWTLRCKNATYRVTLIPDMAAHVELIK
jgi:hypothetical protein